MLAMPLVVDSVDCEADSADLRSHIPHLECSSNCLRSNQRGNTSLKLMALPDAITSIRISRNHELMPKFGPHHNCMTLKVKFSKQVWMMHGAMYKITNSMTIRLRGRRSESYDKKYQQRMTQGLSHQKTRKPLTLQLCSPRESYSVRTVFHSPHIHHCIIIPGQLQMWNVGKHVCLEAVS